MTDMRDVFDAREYLARYFAEPSAEDRFTLTFWIEQIRQLPPGVRVLEYGGGPTLYSVLALARKASTVHFSDYMPASLNEVRRWIAGDAGAHDWRPYIRFMLELEGAPSDKAAVALRETALRRQMTHLSVGDARTPAMLEEPRPPYDVITAHHCLDVAARDFTDFKRMVTHLADMLTSGGLFLLSITTGTTLYTVDGATFPCLDLTTEQLREALSEAGMDPQRVFQAAMPIEREEYNGVILSAGWKRP
ncbi:MAG TPA: guanitoxin biosynthesis pre-guanitoxin forming N-methyltransferase GntF [Anaerolineae bacterium]|nr:guanitoxin biosynthesis pre-guanitoxin forming N-methyltransferase GntF [Anaerolineae bacterium]